MKKKEFKKAVMKPIVVNDSRFGIRKMFINSQERPRIATYGTPGRGQSGEHQT